VTWSLRYRRMLDPAWYFGPMQRYANQLTAGYLIDTLATPAGPPGPRTPERPIGLYSGPGA
jgi:hypothetical protein